MSDQSKTLELCKKPKALSERGEGGEALNAGRMLRSILEKNNISMEQLEEDMRDWRWFKINSADHTDLFFQIVANTIMDYDGSYHRLPRNKREYAVMATISEQVEICAKYEVYSAALERQLKQFRTAFIYKNEIFPIRSGKTDNVPRSERHSAEEQRAISMMTIGIDRTEYIKQIES